MSVKEREPEKCKQYDGFEEWLACNESLYVCRNAPATEIYYANALIVSNRFDLNNFAYLISLLTHDATVRRTLLSSGKEITRP